jgi:2-C-methyl-D-erythritol 2,4-cyclodiphosphate synthase
MSMSGYRIGYGYDVHALAEGRKLMLGGICVTEDFGAIAHSDGDVLLHAVCDALLGAAALGDIGKHFPDSDVSFKGISSLMLLKETMSLLAASGYQVVNMDSTILLEKPKIASFVPAMRAAVASVLGVPDEQISIKATTSEKLGFVGEGRGIAAHAVVIIEKA